MNRGRPTSWSDDDIIALRWGAAMGLSMSEVGRQIGYSRAAVSGKAFRIGVRFAGGVSEHQREAAAQLGRATAAMRKARKVANA